MSRSCNLLGLRLRAPDGTAYTSGYSGPVRVVHDGKHIPVEDEADIPAHLRGYVQLALDLNVLNAYFALEQGRFGLTPTVKAYFHPAEHVTRAAYAVAGTRQQTVRMMLVR